MSSGEPTGAELEARLQDGYALDHLWRETMGLPPGDTKEKPLRLVTDLLERGGVAYALIGGVALQLHSQEPRTTRDIDLAVREYKDVPREALLDAGFEHTGRHQHSDNWLAPAAEPALRTVVQFSAEEPGFVAAVDRATLVDIGDLRLRLATAPDLIVLKLVAAEDPSPRQSKRQHDLGDILTLLEEQPQFHGAIQDLSERLEAVQRGLLSRSLER